MRWNLALTYGLDAAEEFLRLHRCAGESFPDQRHWDVVTLLDLVYDLDPERLARLRPGPAGVLLGERARYVSPSERHHEVVRMCPD